MKYECIYKHQVTEHKITWHIYYAFYLDALRSFLRRGKNTMAFPVCSKCIFIIDTLLDTWMILMILSRFRFLKYMERNQFYSQMFYAILITVL